MKLPSAPRIDLLEPAVMLATVLQWLILASLTGLVVGRFAAYRGFAFRAAPSPTP